MKKIFALMSFVALTTFVLAGTASAAVGDGLTRVVIKGTDVNLRWYPDTKDADAKAGKVNTGDTFIAETVEVECYGNKSDPRWYRLLCPVSRIADGWTPRLVSARFAEKKPLTKDDIKRLASFSYGKPSAERAMKTSADYIDHGPRMLASDLADFASRYGGKAESSYSNEFPGMVIQHAEADGISSFFRHFASAQGFSTLVTADITRPGLSMGDLTVGKTTRDDARRILGDPDLAAGDDEDAWGDSTVLMIGYDDKGAIRYISVQSDL